MKRPGTLAAVVLVATALGALHAEPALAQSDVEPRAVRSPFRASDPAVPASLQEIYRRIAAYWEDHNARAIAHLAGSSRVYVVVQRMGVNERLAASQLHYVLQELFEDTQEIEVRFPAYTAYDPAAGTAYAVGERVWLDSQGAAQRVDRIFVSARNDNGRWLLTEIRLTIE